MLFEDLPCWGRARRGKKLCQNKLPTQQIAQQVYAWAYAELIIAFSP